MSVTTKKVRCFTQVQSKSNLFIKSRKVMQQPIAETLRKQAKFINPYTQMGCRTQSKTLLKFQRPHSIALITKRQQKVKSQIKLNPYNAAAQSESQQQQKYKMDKATGKGMYGTIYRGWLQQTNQKVAIKKVPQEPRSKKLQVGILKQFNHCNILTILDHFYTLQNGRRFLCIVTQLFDTDLFHYIREKRNKITEDSLKRYAYHILKGLQEIHRKSIVHRDLKSSNIFIDKQSKRAVIGDFGSARQLSLGESASGEPCPYSYRPPQLLFGSNHYFFSSDMWSFGCILLEMNCLSLPFKSRNNTEQLLQIMNLLGTPTFSDVLQMNEDYDEKEYNMLPKVKGKGIKENFHLDNTLNDLLSKIFVYSPSKRITASEALKHEYFYDVSQYYQTFSVTKSTDRSLIFNTPSKRKEQETLNTIASFQDQSPKDIRQQLKLQTSKILLNRNGINIPLKINRKLQF